MSNAGLLDTKIGFRDRARHLAEGNLHFIEEFVQPRAGQARPGPGLQPKGERAPGVFHGGVAAVSVAGFQQETWNGRRSGRKGLVAIATVAAALTAIARAMMCISTALRFRPTH